MSIRRVVLDTNVIVSALRSRRGASYALLLALADAQFEIALSVPVVIEYEAVAKRSVMRKFVSAEVVDDVLDYLCTVAIHQQVFFLWRPYLSDPKDDAILELAVASGASSIITHNQKHFQDIHRFGVTPLRPSEFLQVLRPQSHTSRKRHHERG
jgi:putative PIN family toxin of toxin-antitoxin system